MKRILSLLIILVLVLSLSACSGEEAQLYEKYASVIEQLEMKNYSAAIEEITQMAMKEQMTGREQTPIVEILANTWTTQAEKGPQSITFKTDGTLTVDGENMTWTTEKGEWAAEMRLHIYEGGVVRYRAWFSTSDRYAVPYITLYYMEEIDGTMQQGDHIGTYYNHPMVTLLFNDWRAVSSYEKVVDNFWMQNGDITINGDNCKWEITDASSQDRLVIHAKGKNEATCEYTMTVTMRGEHPIMVLTDDSTQSSGLYYNSHFGKEDTWVEVVYPKAVEYLNNLKNNGQFRIDDQTYRYENAVNCLYDLFSSLESYRDSAELVPSKEAAWFYMGNYYLQRYLNDGYFRAGNDGNDYYNDQKAVSFLHELFSGIAGQPDADAVLEDWDSVLLVQANRYLKSYLDNGYIYLDDRSLSKNDALAFLYALFAEIPENEEAAAVLKNFVVVPQKYTGGTYVTIDNLGNESKGTWETFKYDAKGRMIYAGYADELFEVYGQTSDLHFYYDDAGLLYEIKYAYNPETNVNALMTPDYDDNGNLISITTTHNHGTMYYTFTYDEAGRRISAIIDKNYGGNNSAWNIYKYTYQYDEAGRLVEKLYVRDSTIQTTTYIYDENGFLIQQTMVETYNYSYNGTTEYHYSETITYTNDAQGRHMTASVTTDKSGDSYKSRTVTFVYEDLYFYFPEG